MINESGAFGGMRTKGNRSARRKPASLPLFPLQIPYDLAWDRTRAAAVESRRLTAWVIVKTKTYDFYRIAQWWIVGELLNGEEMR
jgi:hypothetical protein